MVHKGSTYFWILKSDLNTNQRTKKRKRNRGERKREDEGERGVGGWLPEALDISPADVEWWRPALLLITASILSSFFFFLLCLISHSASYLVSKTFWFLLISQNTHAQNSVSVPLFLKSQPGDSFLSGWLWVQKTKKTKWMKAIFFCIFFYWHKAPQNSAHLHTHTVFLPEILLSSSKYLTIQSKL